jgi:predicted Zn-dependent peptidase
VKAELLYGEESTPSHIFALARQVALTGQIIPSDRVEATINKVTLQDVQNVSSFVLCNFFV